MNKKYITILAVLLVLAQTLAYYSIVSKGNITPVSADTEIVAVKDLSDVGTLVKPAIEYYLTQNKSDSTDTRNERLSLYLSADSPIFTRPVSNLGTGIIKTVASVSKVTLIGQEGKYENILTQVKTKSFTTDDEYTTSTDYYVVALIKASDDSYLIYNIGKSE